MKVDAKLGPFKYFVHKFKREDDNKTVFTFADYQDFMTIVTVDRIQKGRLTQKCYFKPHNILNCLSLHLTIIGESPELQECPGEWLIFC